jgi:DNA-binding NarL/FixJ family response regulator
MSLANVLIVEDDSYLRSLSLVSFESAGLHVVVATSRAGEAIEAVKNELVDVAVLDLYLGPGPTGIDIAVSLRAINPQIGLIFLTSFSDPRLLESQSELPAGSIYLTKSKISGVREIVTAILRSKHSPLSTKRDQVEDRTLTDNQMQVWRLVSQGMKNSKIAETLGVSESAVEHVIKRIALQLDIELDPTINLRVQLVREFSHRTGQQLPETQ